MFDLSQGLFSDDRKTRAAPAAALSIGTLFCDDRKSPGTPGPGRAACGALDRRFVLDRPARARIDANRGQAHGFPFRDATGHVRGGLALREPLPCRGQGTSAGSA